MSTPSFAPDQPVSAVPSSVTSRPLNHRQHLRSLDGLRGLAILAVVFFHLYPRSPHDPLSYLAGLGWLGVDLFFVLSGFLITGILVDTRQQPHFFRNFFARRSLRVFPVYFFMVAVLLVLAWVLGRRLSAWAIPFFLYGSNIVSNLGHHTGLEGPVDLDHLWSLAIEEQFYLVWAPVLFLLRTHSRILRACLIGSLLAFLLRWGVELLHPPFYVAYAQLPTRMDGFLLGGALALLFRSPASLPFLHSRWITIGLVSGAVVLLLCVAVAHTSYWSSRPMVLFGYSGAAILFSSLVALALRPSSWAALLGSFTPLRILGRYSYGLYLWHMLPHWHYLHWMERVSARTAHPALVRPLAFLLVFLLNLGIAVVSYHTVELFFLRLKRFFAYRDEQRAHAIQVDPVDVIPVPSSPSTP